MSIMQTYGRSDFVFKKLSIKEQLRIEREKSMQLLNKHTMLEVALLETTTLLADEQMKNTQNEQAILELTTLMAGGDI